MIGGCVKKMNGTNEKCGAMIMKVNGNGMNVSARKMKDTSGNFDKKKKDMTEKCNSTVLSIGKLERGVRNYAR